MTAEAILQERQQEAQGLRYRMRLPRAMHRVSVLIIAGALPCKFRFAFPETPL